MQTIMGVIADDLTGGMETASMFVALGVGCGFVTRPELVASSAPEPVMVVAQKTRVIPAADATRQCASAADALLGAGARQLFFKYCATFDSTDEGNIGPVTDRLLEMVGEDRTLFCPTAPAAGRTVYNGHLFVGSELVSDSPKRFDPLTPMTDPDLVRVLQRQTRAKVGFLPHRLVRHGGEPLRAYVEEAGGRGVKYWIADAIYDEDLAALATLAADWRLVTGNSPIVQHFPPLWRERGWLDDTPRKQALPAIESPGIVLAGSCAERTLEQLAAFEQQRPVLRIDIASADGPEAAIGESLAWAREHLGSGPVAIATSAAPDAVSAAQARLGREGAAKFAEEILSGLAVALHEMGVRRFVVAGGETSGAVVERLGIDRLSIGAYQGPGVARATTEGGDPIGLCLKSGKLGPVGMFLPTLESMRRAEI